MSEDSGDTSFNGSDIEFINSYNQNESHGFVSPDDTARIVYNGKDSKIKNVFKKKI